MVVSARPDNLEETADNWKRLNGTEGFSGKHTALAEAFNSFTTSNGWGALNASALIGNVGTWVSANTGDANFTRAVAAAFRAADTPGSDGISVSTDGELLTLLGSMMRNVDSWDDLERADLQVTWSAAYGGQTTTGFTADPVSTASGNFFEAEVDLGFGPTLRSLQLRRSYNSLGSFVGPFGPGWSSWLSTRLRLSGSGSWVRLRGPDGQVAEVPMPDGTVPGFEGRVELLGEAAARLAASSAVSSDGFPVEGRSAERHIGGATGDGGTNGSDGNHAGAGAPEGAPVLVARFDKERMAWLFDAQGRPVLLDEGPGTKVHLSWDGERLVGMAHERGRSFSLEWEGERVVAAVADDGRRVTYHYDDLGRLVRVEAPTGDRFYEWNDADRIAAVTDADGVVALRNTYDELGRVTVQDTPAGRRVRFWYRPGLVTEVDDENGGPTNVWVHDDSARLVKVVDGHGEAMTKAYDDEGRVVRIKDRRGALTRFEWDARDNPTRVEHPNGTVLETTYDELGRILTTTGPGGGTARFTYDGDSRHPSTIEDPEGGVTRLQVDGDLVKEIVDPDGVTARFDHDAQGRLVAITDGAGGTTHVEYHPTGQPSAVTTPLGHRTEYERDAAGRLLARLDPDGAVTRIERSPAGRPVAMVDPSGGRHELRFGADGELEAELDPSGAVTSFQRDVNGSITQAVMPDGGKWSFEHDALMRVVGVTDPSGSSWLHEHDADGALVGSISPTGVHRKIAVDPTGEIQSVDDGLAQVGFEYDAAGRPVAQVRPDGTRAQATYDRCGRVVTTTELGGGVTRFEHTPGGRLAAVVGPTGARTTYAYDTAGRLRETVLPTGGRVRFRYDADNRVVRVTGPTGEVTQYSYDAAGRVVAVMAPSSGVVRYDYDAAGRLVTTTGPDGATTRYGYDVAGRVAKVVDPNGGAVSYDHDVMGRVVAHTDPLGARYGQTLDPVGRPTETIDPLGRRTTFTYDQAGRLVGRVDPDGSRHWWRWDDSDRLAAQGSDGTETTFQRDLLGRIVRIDRDGELAVSREWDADDNLVTETTDTHTLRRGYDAAGNVTFVTVEVPGFAPLTTRYERDAAGRITAVDDPATGRITIDRDLSGRPSRIAGPGMVETRNYSDGFLTAWTREIAGLPTQSVRYTRDQSGRIVHEHHGDGRDVDYAYDAAGQLTEIREGDHHWRFDYDAAGRLVQEDTPGGTRTFTYDAAGQLERIVGPAGETRYEWDACGRRTAEVGPHGTRRFHWNSQGLPDRITTTSPEGTASTRNLTHDAVGRLARIDDASLVWDGGRLAAVGGHRLVGAGTTTWAVTGPDGPESHGGGAAAQGGRPALGGGSSWLSTNARGEAFGLDPWGTQANGATPDRLAPLPAGLSLGHRGELDVDGLTWLRARAYDPGTRSFLSPDPLPGLAGHPWGANTYHYAANDPVGHVDPLGLQPVTDAQLANIRDTWDDNAAQRYEGYIIAGALIVAGAVLVATGVGGIVGGALIGMAIAGAISAGTQQYFNGGVSYGQLAMDMALGAVGGGAGAAATLSTQGLKFGARYAIRAGVDMTVNVGSGMATRAYNGENPLDPQGLGFDVLTGGVSAGAGETMDAIGDARMHARMRPNVNNPLGMSPQDATTAMANPQRLQHATRHLRPDPNDPTGGVIPTDRLPADTSQLNSTPQGNTVYGNWKGSTSPGEVRADVGPILERPFATFQGTNLGGTPTTGYLGSVNGQTVAVQVFDSGPKAGEVATTVIPSPAQLSKWGITN